MVSLAFAAKFLIQTRAQSLAFALFACLFFALVAVTALLPNKLWNLELFLKSFSMDYAYEMEPKTLSLILREISILACLILATLFFLLAIAVFTQ